MSKSKPAPKGPKSVPVQTLVVNYPPIPLPPELLKELIASTSETAGALGDWTLEKEICWRLELGLEPYKHLRLAVESEATPAWNVLKRVLARTKKTLPDLLKEIAFKLYPEELAEQKEEERKLQAKWDARDRKAVAS